MVNLNYWNLIISYSFMLLTNVFGDEQTVLKLLHIVSRHGIRTPVNLYPTDPYNASFWAQYDGLGQLTPAGINQHYQFGQYVATTYQNFLTQPYSRSRVNVKSTSYDRALMSAAGFLAGLYPLSSNQIWNSAISNWRPIPVFSNSKDLDPVLRQTCPLYDKLKAEQQQTDEYFQIQNQNAEFIAKMRNYSQMPDLDLYKMWRIADNYMVENALNLTEIPPWVIQNKTEILRLNDYNFYFDYRTYEMARLVAGGILNDMVKNINNKISNNSSMELYVYSSHDTFIAALHKLLNLTNPIVQPNFASALFFELRKSLNSSQYYIQAYYKNNVDNTPITRTLLPIGDCGTLCRLDTFLANTNGYLITDYTNECLIQANKVAGLNGISFGFLFIAFVINFFIPFI